MESEVICLDTSVLIDYYRKKNKSKTFFYELAQSYSSFAVSVITEYEILAGSNADQDKFWSGFFEEINILPFNREANKSAIEIQQQLKAKNKLISIPDILIAATALSNNLKIATLNKKDFERVERLEIIGQK